MQPLTDDPFSSGRISGGSLLRRNPDASSPEQANANDPGPKHGQLTVKGAELPMDAAS